MSTQKTPDQTSAHSDASQAKQKAGEMTENAKSAARDVAQDAASAAKDHAETAKSSVADEMSGVASALRTAAEEMRSGSPQERTFGQIAEGLADASEAMRNKDLSEMVQDVSAFARKNPLVFLGGAALIGFAATRFAKASNTRDPQAILTARGTTPHGEIS
ncbi:hypothetical protein [uncultured Roseobacter sp.]|uniref:hypothetical protein n=1 Tax=uncultured Roseobacter sp. TaxID=114847 RepID=UPI00261DE07D|nr:hypothetical protein [uncultured Roseobacter sp.]